MKIVELNIAGILIGKSASDTPFLKSAKVTGDSFEANKALDLMGKHFYKTKTKFQDQVDAESSR